MQIELIHYSFLVNVIFFFLFYRLYSFFDKPGQKNFFIDSIKVAFNRVKGANLVTGATNDRSLNIYWRSQNDPIRPSQHSQSLPLQFEPRNLFHTWKGMPATFAFEGFLSNTNPLETGNDDIELSQIAQGNEVYCEAEVQRRIMHNNPFKEIRKMQLIQLAAIGLGFIVVIVLLNDFKTGIESFKTEVLDIFNSYKPVIDAFVAEQQRRVVETVSPGVV